MTTAMAPHRSDGGPELSGSGDLTTIAAHFETGEVAGTRFGRQAVASDRPEATHGGTMRIGMLTGGGDCPGLNAVMRAVVRKGDHTWGDEIIGFRDGWKGVIEGGTLSMDIELMRGTLPRGGTILGSSR